MTQMFLHARFSGLILKEVHGIPDGFIHSFAPHVLRTDPDEARPGPGAGRHVSPASAPVNPFPSVSSSSFRAHG